MSSFAIFGNLNLRLCLYTLCLNPLQLKLVSKNTHANVVYTITLV